MPQLKRVPEEGERKYNNKKKLSVLESKCFAISRALSALTHDAAVCTGPKTLSTQRLQTPVSNGTPPQLQEVEGGKLRHREASS